MDGWGYNGQLVLDNARQKRGMDGMLGNDRDRK